MKLILQHLRKFEQQKRFQYTIEFSFVLNLVYLKTPKNAFEKMVQEMTDTMVRVTLSNATTTDTTTVCSSVASSHSTITLTNAQSSSSSSTISSTLPIQSILTNMKEKKSRPTKIHTFDDYLLYILKWPASLIDELGLIIFIVILI